MGRVAGDGRIRRGLSRRRELLIRQLVVSRYVEHRRDFDPTVPSSPGDRQSLRIVTKKLSPSIGELFRMAES